MNTKTLSIYWIDDESDRFSSFVPLIQGTVEDYGYQVSITPVLVTDQFEETLKGWEKTPPNPLPDIFIVDQVFSKAGTLPFQLNGNTSAHLLRRTFPMVPIVCCTAMYDNARPVEGDEIHEYAEVYHYNQLGSRIENIFAIARDYRLLSTLISGESPLEKFIELAHVPEEERASLGNAFPIELRQSHGLSPTRLKELAQWIISSLIRRPGFLYDKIRVATVLGLSITGFDKVKHLFESTRYRGPFWTESEPRWWQAELSNTLFKILSNKMPNCTQLAGRMLENISASDYSSCYVSGHENVIPDVVAQLYPNEEWVAVNFRYTRPHPQIRYLPPGFEIPLVVGK
jgi:hypothetical protein